MLRRYLQNTDVNMTKEAYFEMCEQLGTEPIESEIPVDVNDFPELVQDCLLLYNLLADQWDTMAGQYLGKDYSLIFQLFDTYNIDQQSERILCLNFLQQLDSVRSKLIRDKLAIKNPQK